MTSRETVCMLRERTCTLFPNTSTLYMVVFPKKLDILKESQSEFYPQAIFCHHGGSQYRKPTNCHWKRKKNLKSNELLESLCLWLILISPKPTIFMAFSAPLGFYWRTKPGHVVLAVAGATDLVLGLRSEGFARSTWRWRGSWKLGLKTRV